MIWVRQLEGYSSFREREYIDKKMINPIWNFKVNMIPLYNGPIVTPLRTMELRGCFENNPMGKVELRGWCHLLNKMCAICVSHMDSLIDLNQYIWAIPNNILRKDTKPFNIVELRRACCMKYKSYDHFGHPNSHEIWPR